MTDAALREALTTLDELAKKATPPPWHAPGLGEIHSDHEHDVFAHPEDDSAPEEIAEGCGDADAAFIVALVNAWPLVRAALAAATPPIAPRPPCPVRIGDVMRHHSGVEHPVRWVKWAPVQIVRNDPTGRGAWTFGWGDDDDGAYAYVADYALVTAEFDEAQS